MSCRRPWCAVACHRIQARRFYQLAFCMGLSGPERIRPIGRTPDGSALLLTQFDGLARSMSWINSRRIPLALALRDGRYVDATLEYPERLQAELPHAEDWLQEEQQRKVERGDLLELTSAAVHCYAVHALLHGREAARAALREKLSAEEWRHVRTELPRVDRVLRERHLRFQYPPPYELKPVAWPITDTGNEAAVFRQPS